MESLSLSSSPSSRWSSEQQRSAYDDVADDENADEERPIRTTASFLGTSFSPSVLSMATSTRPTSTTSFLPTKRRGGTGLSTAVVVLLVVVGSSVGITYWGLETTRPRQEREGSTATLYGYHGDDLPLVSHDDNQLPRHHHHKKHQKDDNEKDNESSVWFDCPTINLQKVTSIQTEEEKSQSEQNPHSEEHQEADLEILQNTTDYLHNFRHLPFDFWPLAYDDYKAAMVKWKQHLLQDFLYNDNDNDDDNYIHIYESASGLGLNLLMTAEILHEQRQQRGRTTTAHSDQHHINVKLYGNDYVVESVELARIILQDDTVLKGGVTGSETSAVAQYGQVCQGDSTQLHEWVPAASFDLVFTGFITPLQDPLSLGLCQEDLQIIYADLCKSREPHDQQQSQLLQQRQEDWFALWVHEMLRLAKPGAVVGVEMISYPQCDDLDEWGGVSHEFWHAAVDRYGWDADPASVVIRDAHMPGRRYHVSMRKKSPSS
eukprot:scaffold6781_cov204-Amphora_coffeaeformis.AAC.7